MKCMVAGYDCTPGTRFAQYGSIGASTSEPFTVQSSRNTARASVELPGVESVRVPLRAAPR